MTVLAKWRILLAGGSACLFAGAAALASAPDPTASCSAVGATSIVTRLGYSFAERDTDHFRLMCRSDRPGLIPAETGDVLERTYRQFYAEFNQAGFQLDPVEGRLAWLEFDSRDQYRDFARLVDGMDSPFLESYYSVKNNQVVLLQTAATPNRPQPEEERDPGRTTGVLGPGLAGMDRQVPEADEHGVSGALDIRRTVHEATHLLAFNSGLQKRGVVYPLWVSEGLATSLESDSLESVGMSRANFRRLRQLQRADQDERLMSLEEFVTLVQIAPNQAAAANDLYAQAWGLFNFLLKNRPTELRNYLRSLSRLDAEVRPAETMRREFTDAFGSFQLLEESWREYLESTPAD